MGHPLVGRGNEQWPEDFVCIKRICVSSMQEPRNNTITLKEAAQAPGKMARDSHNCQAVVA
eukprot:366341-Pyramimonas_sp.AAC.1